MQLSFFYKHFHTILAHLVWNKWRWKHEVCLCLLEYKLDLIVHTEWSSIYHCLLQGAVLPWKQYFPVQINDSIGIIIQQSVLMIVMTFDYDPFWCCPVWCPQPVGFLDMSYRHTHFSPCSTLHKAAFSKLVTRLQIDQYRTFNDLPLQRWRHSH